MQKLPKTEKVVIGRGANRRVYRRFNCVKCNIIVTTNIKNSIKQQTCLEDREKLAGHALTANQ